MKAVRWAEGLEPLLQPIENARPNPDNPNNGDVDSVIESIQVSGFNQVITVDKNTGYIEAGHTRWAALHALGSKVAPFVWVDHDEEGMARYLIGDNETGRLARMDPMQEARILKMLHETERGLIGTGVTQEKYMDKLIAAANTQVSIPSDGFGPSVAPSGIFQVVASFRDEDERDELMAELADRHELEGKIRSVNL